jgi:hypothetical protein
VHATVGPKTATLALQRKPKSNAELELWAAEKEQQYFKQVFGKQLVLMKAT